MDHHEQIHFRKDIEGPSLSDRSDEQIRKFSTFLEDLGDNYEQKKAVVSDCNRILVLAGAGSGKTKVLTKRFIHLIKNKGVHKDEILGLTFTKAAADEMRARISKSLGVNQDHFKNNVRTFHSFCFSLLKQNEQFGIIAEKDQREIVESILLDLGNNDNIARNIYNYIRDNIIEKAVSRDSKANKMPQSKSKPDNFGEKNIRTSSGELVRSKSERDIADFLTRLGLKWQYEPPTDFGEGKFKPDFLIEDKIYLEHWCYENDTPEFSKINKKKYLRHRSWKENQYKKFGNILISVEEREMLDLSKLQQRLVKIIRKNINREIQEQDVMNLLNLTPNYRNSYRYFVDEILEIINLSKSRMLEVEDVKSKIDGNKKEKIEYFFNVLIPVLEKYQDVLGRIDYGKKDFNDLIKDSVNLLRNNPSRRSYYQNKIKYVLVDEFQDVSYGEVELLKMLVTQDTHLFAVGDDWQSIYGWRGADVNYILNFDRYFGETEKIVLPINYRSKKHIVDASNFFIQNCKGLYKKNIRCSMENEEGSEKILQLNAKDDFNGARYVCHKINKLMEENPGLKLSDFLILIRSSRALGGYKKIFDQKELKVPVHTIHWSKGTEFEYVFVLGMKGGSYGFPNIYADKDIKRIIYDIPVEEKEEEERRLFYVAMTRAKKRLFLISENENESEFVAELPKKNKYVMS